MWPGLFGIAVFFAHLTPIFTALLSLSLNSGNGAKERRTAPNMSTEATSGQCQKVNMLVPRHCLKDVSTKMSSSRWRWLVTVNFNKCSSCPWEDTSSNVLWVTPIYFSDLLLADVGIVTPKDRGPRQFTSLFCTFSGHATTACMIAVHRKRIVIPRSCYATN